MNIVERKIAGNTEKMPLRRALTLEIDTAMAIMVPAMRLRLRSFKGD
jgi:hypothetical protein